MAVCKEIEGVQKNCGPTGPCNEVVIKCLIDRECLLALGDEQFRSNWEALYSVCPWASAFQSGAFAEIWYSVYIEMFKPFIICGYDGTGRLSGVLALATKRGSDDIVHVGSHHAEYQAWLATAEYYERFLDASIGELRKHFPKGRLRLQYLPPNFPVDALRNTQYRGCVSQIQTVRQPLMCVTGAGLAELLGKKHTRSSIRKLSQRGLKVEVLRSRKELEPLFDDIEQYCDLRQGAVNDNMPFRKDPLKREFYLRLADNPILTHTTVLRVDEGIVGAHIGTIQQKSVQLGLLVHSPFYGLHSPGKLLILLLGKTLAESGFTDIDLTPGGEYKERFADHSADVYSVDIGLREVDARRNRFRVRAMQTIRRGFELARVDPVKVRFAMARGTAALQTFRTMSSVRKACRRGMSKVAGRDELRFLLLDAHEAVGLPATGRFRRNCLWDLLVYRPRVAGDVSRSEFLQAALYHLERGNVLYTLVEGEELVYCGWIDLTTSPIRTEFEMDIERPSGSAVLCDDYFRSAADRAALYSASIRCRAIDARNSGAQQILISTRGTGRALRDELQGGRPYATLVRTNRLGLQRCSRKYEGVISSGDVSKVARGRAADLSTNDVCKP